MSDLACSLAASQLHYRMEHGSNKRAHNPMVACRPTRRLNSQQKEVHCNICEVTVDVAKWVNSLFVSKGSTIDIAFAACGSLCSQDARLPAGVETAWRFGAYSNPLEGKGPLDTA